MYYVHKLFYLPKDNILQRTIYQDLSEEYAYLNKRLIGKKHIVFVGDSITKGFNFQEYFPNHTIINRGIFSDTTFGLLKRLDRNVVNLYADKIFLMIGYNDLEYRTNGEILRNIADILKQFKTETVYVQSLLSVDATLVSINARIVEINKGIKALCKRHSYVYINLHSHFSNDKGGINRAYSRDGVHPNGSGYLLWSKLVAPFIIQKIGRGSGQTNND